MAEPKKKLSSARSGWRRSQVRLQAMSLAVCPKCRTAIVPHTVCLTCGTYAGKQVIDMAKKEKKSQSVEQESEDQGKKE